MGGGFPVKISATIMDEEVIEAGFSYYEHVIGMTQQESDGFRQRYRNLHQLDQYYLMELSLRTTLTEDYLDFSRWTIFVEDDQGRKYEPDKITEQPLSSNQNTIMMTKQSMAEPIPIQMSLHEKIVFFYFPQKDFYGKPTFDKDIKKLTLVFILEKGGAGRAQGSWIF
jgi:hypothetical protein